MKQIYILTTVAVVSLLPQAVTDENNPPAVPDIVEARQQTVVKLFGAGLGNLDSYGSGIIISEDGLVVTVWNHLVNNGFLTAVTADGQRHEVVVVGTSLKHDLAILRLDTAEPQKFPFIDYRSAGTLKAGDGLLAFSNEYHVATGNEPVSVMHGVLACESPLNAGLGRWDFPVKSPVYLIDAIVNNSGAAGGLVTDTTGAPVGMLGREIRHRDTNMWVNYAVPLKTLEPAISTILSGQRIRDDEPEEEDRVLVSDRKLTAVFGITVLPSILKKTPAYIDRIVPGSAAEVAELQRGDLVLMVEDDVIQSVEDLRAALATHRKGQSISVTVNRNNSLAVKTLIVP